ncbi:hypothetical protein QBC46DRAFT_93592 [Diplogelasinospora grovesii]|uniref:Uncharacterized protein n=1 Tax=Diplogelasinospora grovesii TaxID=303347 RepID=A0AAN6NI43_9PEZI|nr:hypothetical protein QBC46DRAFT_93592 [Diplogelasinospora grovesii]
MGNTSSTEVPTGAAAWFPYGRQDLPGWRFDVITLLAVIGESSVAEHAQTLTASSMCLLPRIIPAPQALLRPTRPQRLPEVTAKMAGVYSGVVLDTVGFFANIIHPLEDLKPFAFKVYEIKHRKKKERASSESSFGRWFTRKTTETTTEGTSPIGGTTSPNSDGKGKGKEVEIGGGDVDIELGSPPPPQPGNIKKSSTVKEKLTDIITNPTMVNSDERYTVPPTYYSPIHILSIFSFLLSVGIIIAAAFWEDGTAIVAIILISLASSFMGYASWWKPLLMSRRATNKVPHGDVVIRTREGAFVLIKCTEEVARELYSGTEECRYVSTKYHRIFMGFGTVLLMVSVVLLGNCSWNSQVFIGAAYIILNGLYWGMGLLPREYFWDLSRYELVDKTPEDAKNAEIQTPGERGDGVDLREKTPSFTRTLWFVIRETKYTSWVERSGAAPRTEQWKRWLDEAQAAAMAGEEGKKWNAVARKDAIMAGTAKQGEGGDIQQTGERQNSGGSTMNDEAQQRAPLSEVQPRRASMQQTSF